MRDSIDTIILLNLLMEEAKSLLDQARKYQVEMSNSPDIEINQIYEDIMIFLLEHSKRLSNAAIGIANID